MNETEQKKSIRELVLEDIKKGGVTMKPKTYFRLKVAALVVLSAAVLFVSVGLFNFLFFTIKINSHEALLGFGPRGYFVFLHFFPWHLLLIDVVLVIALRYLLSNFRFGYRIPMLYLIGALFALAAIVGFALAETPFNERVMDRAGRLPPPIAGFYDRARRPPPQGSGVCRCEILAIEGNTLTVQDTRNGTSTLTVVLPANDARATTTLLSVGDVVLIAGEEEGGVIQAFGVRKEMRRERNMSPLRP